MRRSSLPQVTHLLAGLLAALLFAAVPPQSTAQTASDTRSARPFSHGYDKTHEITLNGSIQEVISQHVAGSPVGLHILVTGSKGVVDAHLGPFLTKDVQEALHLGTPVQIVGAMETIRDKNYLLARQLIFGGRMVTVRSENGFLVRAHNTRQTPSTFSSQNDKSSQVELNGGAR